MLISMALASALAAGVSNPLFADVDGIQVTMQTVKVTGTVLGPDGFPIIGASVLEKGTSNGVITDIDGNYTINVSSKNSVIVISYIGYKVVELKASDKNLSMITMAEDSELLDEVVVVGYGTQKKATLTGSIEQVNGKALESRAVTNVGLALQGQTPGLTVTRTSPRPGNEDLSFQIRGATSVNGGSPLIVIDGVPAINGQSFQNMNSDDIESISVLKDGAASIYGAKAANGVILVTTKKGKGKLKVDYNFNMRFNTLGITGYSSTMEEYAQMWLAANDEEEVENWWAWVSRDNMEKMAQGIEGIYPTQYYGDIFIGNANRIDEMFATRFSYQHNLSLAGSTEKSDYRISLAYADNQGNLATAYDGQKQLNLRMNYGNQLTKWLKLETAASLVQTNTEGPSVGLDASLYAQEMPLFPAKNPYGQWYADYGTIGDRQPVAATADGGRDNKKSLTSRIDVKAIVDIWRGISFEGMASFQNEEFRRERYVTPVQTYDWFGNPAEQVVSVTKPTLSTTDPSNLAHNNPGYLTVAENYFYQYYSALLKYNNKFGEHNVSALLGINAEKNQVKKVAAGRLNFTDDGVYDLNVADSELLGNSGGKYHNGTYSYIAKLNYDYKEKYLLELMGRRDGNLKFAKDYRFQNYGSFSLGWVFTQENFIKPISSFIGLDFGKVRLSYGASGNDVGLGNYDYVSTINQGTAILGYPAASVISTSLNNSGLISLTRTWERVEQKNIGVDLNFLNNRLVFNWDYFIKENKGMLSSVSYPSVLGGSAPKTNSGHLRVRGWEVSLTWRDRVKDFNYFISANLSDSRSKLMDLEGADTFKAGKNNLNGYPLNSWFLYKTDGYFANQEEVDAYYAKYANKGGDMAKLAYGSQTELRPGDIKRVDMSGDKCISAEGGASSDLIYMGDANVHYTFGITLGGDWKGIDFNALFQGVGKQLIMRQGWMAYPFSATYTNQNPSFLGKTWTEDNPNAEYPRLTVYSDRAAWNYLNNDFMLQNNRYIRLKSLVVGYTLPRQWTIKAKLEKVRLYFSGNDLWEATQIKDGFDPEMGEMSQNSGYPFSRTWSFGINVTL
ncbi:TonB-dependent receptor [Bacteroides sp.]|uniref:SusC/RagA family TonB-linked outer membrane protein n=1 Tax=Bacteroides sp. TaxID=29523 RepID=UPI0025C35435|nr:TonB-dependent receptor [Bacteroides sp.]